MAYDKEKAHDYYIKYRKKGLKKGRKKGSKKKTGKGRQENLVGLNTSNLNDAGKMQAAMIKNGIKKEMNVALANAKTDSEKQKIRQEYQQKALNEIGKLKSNSQYAKPQKAAGTKGSAGSKSAGESSRNENNEGQKKKTSVKKEQVDRLTSIMNDLQKKAGLLSDKQKEQVRMLLMYLVTKLGTKGAVSSVKNYIERNNILKDKEEKK